MMYWKKELTSMIQSRCMAYAPSLHKKSKIEDADETHSVIATLPEEWPQDDQEDESGLEKFADSTRLVL